VNTNSNLNQRDLGLLATKDGMVFLQMENQTAVLGDGGRSSTQ
jgi:hypothetical protein